MTDNQTLPNLAELSDDEIMNLDPDSLPEETENEDPPPPETGEVDQSATGEEVEDTDSEETGGAESEDDSTDDDTGGADTTSAEEDDEESTEARTEVFDEQTSEDDQTSEESSEEATTTEDSTSDIDYKAEYSKLLAPFKAAKREIKVETPDDARRLMQMGVDYARKMEAMKPYRRVLKTLEKADLVDVDQINYLIDLANKKPEAIKKLLKDSEIDPMDLDLEDSVPYKPTDHIVGDNEIALDDVIDEIRATPTFDRTVDIITKQWDDGSKLLLQDNPGVIAVINDHVQRGIYDQIANKVATEKALGRLNGVSDLVAYKTVGDAMQENGDFDEPNSGAPPPAGNTHQGGSHPNGSGLSSQEVKDRKRAASPTKGSASAKKEMPDFSKMSDDEIEKFDINSL